MLILLNTCRLDYSLRTGVGELTYLMRWMSRGSSYLKLEITVASDAISLQFFSPVPTEGSFLRVVIIIIHRQM